MTINRRIFTRRTSRWSPVMERLPEPFWLAVLGGAGIGVVMAMMLYWGI